jgi:hypothetical protein
MRPVPETLFSKSDFTSETCCQIFKKWFGPFGQFEQVRFRLVSS